MNSDNTEPAADSSPEVVETADATTLDPWEQLEAEAAKWKEVALRTAADLDNFRKRAAREREDAMRFANQRLLEELLPVIDNFEMGMMAASKDQGSMIYIGMDMVRRQLADFLASQGVEEIPSEGKAFDPNIHEAVTQEESSTVADGHVLRVTRRGFRLRDRLLRPASVIVSKAPASGGGEA
jgi:molecular chaperone GrpE